MLAGNDGNPLSQNPCAILPLAAMGELAENSRQGLATQKINSHPGWSAVNFRTATGIGASLRRNVIRPHCQSWNAYSYAGNNPTTFTDPSGETYRVCQTDENGNQTNCANISDEQFGQFEEENSKTLEFTGSGVIAQNGTEIGTYQRTSVDLSPDAALIFHSAGASATAQIKSFMVNVGIAAGGEALGAVFVGADALAAEEGTSLGLREVGATEGKALPALNRLTPKIQDDMAARGWTRQDILDVFEKGVQSPVVDRTTGFTSATQYLDPATGRFAVVNDATGNVVQVSKVGFRPNPPAR